MEQGSAKVMEIEAQIFSFVHNNLRQECKISDTC